MVYRIITLIIIATFDSLILFVASLLLLPPLSHCPLNRNRKINSSLLIIPNSRVYELLSLNHHCLPIETCVEHNLVFFLGLFDEFRGFSGLRNLSSKSRIFRGFRDLEKPRSRTTPFCLQTLFTQRWWKTSSRACQPPNVKLSPKCNDLTSPPPTHAYPNVSELNKLSPFSSMNSTSQI